MKLPATARPSLPKKNPKGGGNTPAPLSTKNGRYRKRRRKPRGGKQPVGGNHSKRQDHDDTACQPCSSPSGTLLERIGRTAVEGDDEDYWTDPDPIWASTTVEGVPGSPFYTTAAPSDPDEVERFLKSVVGPPPPASLEADACLENQPSLALETHHLPVDLRPVKVEDPSSPSHTPVNSLPPLDSCQQSPLPDDTMSPPSVATIEECRKRLIPVLLTSAQARDPGRRLDSDQCHRLLSDDHCARFIRQARDMRRQLSSLVAQKTPVYHGWSGSQKRDRAEDVVAWIRNTRGSRFNSVNTVASDVSRRDSDITLVDFPGGKLPPKAPRAMLLASQAIWNDRPLNDALCQAPYDPLVASPTTEDHLPSATSLTELVHQAAQLFPTLMSTTEPVMEIDMSNAPTGDPLAVSPGCTDFVSYQPTQPGVWFSQRGRRRAEIVDVDVDLGDEIFCASKERLRMHLRLCSVPADAPCAENDHGGVPASLQQVDGLTERHALRWPKKGKLVVQVNPDSERSQTWLPYMLESDPLDVASCMRPGKNTFRFIQLSDLSAFTFMLVASPLPPEEEWRSWDWAAFVARRPSSPTVDLTNGSSEFAQVGVAVRA